MELRELVRRRRMVRRYSPDPIAPASVDRILDHAARAPSAGFSQGWAFLVLDRPADVELYWAATTPPGRAEQPDGWLRGMRIAPLVVVPMSAEGAYPGRPGRRVPGGVRHP